MGIAAILQLGAGLVAGYYLQQVIEEKHVELSIPRPEDTELLELEAQAREKEEREQDLISWEVLPCLAKGVLFVGFSLTEAMLVIFAAGKTLFGVPCFTPFDVTSSIAADLGGNPLNIMQPLGWLGTALFAGSMCCLMMFKMWARIRVRSLYW